MCATDNPLLTVTSIKECFVLIHQCISEYALLVLSDNNLSFSTYLNEKHAMSKVVNKIQKKVNEGGTTTTTMFI